MTEGSIHRISMFSEALPSGWASATIGELIGRDGLFVDGDWVESKDQDPAGDVRLIQLADVGDGAYLNKSNRFLTNLKAIGLRCTFLKPDDLLIARMPEPLGRACIFPSDSKPCITVVDVCIVRTGVHGASQHWLMHAINSPAVRSAIEGLQSGSTRKRISRGNLAKLEVPLPPFPEQHHIVAKIEELFTRLDAGVASLKKIKAQLKSYRQAVLKQAFEGKLTEEWRQTHKHELEPASALLDRIKQERQKSTKYKYKELPPLDTSDLPELSEGWVWTRLGEISDVVSGQTPKEIGNYGSSGEIPYFRVGDMNKSGNEKHMFHSEIALGLADIERLRLRVQPIGTVIFPKRGGAIATNKKRILAKPSAYDLNVMGVYPLIMPHRFLYYWMVSIDLARLSDGSNVPQINHTDIEPLAFPLPSLPERHQIVSEIERRFSVADGTEKIVDHSLKQAERLRQSILKRAFEGKLVPQDPNDEPAEKLLDRIRMERERTNKPTLKKRSQGE